MGESDRPVIRVICGPTSAGKSQLALICARFADISVISADSRQLYRGFNAGTAKPTAAERAAVPHFGIDVLDPVARASAAWWGECADTWIRTSFDAGRTPVVVGGTGLYLRALFGTTFDEIPLDADIRHAVQLTLAQLTTPELRRWVEALDPSRALLGRTQLLRSIEVALLTGRRLSDMHRERARSPRWPARYLLVDPGPALAPRIADRTRAMFDAGWAEEVRALERVVPDDAPAWSASGYGAVRAHLHGTLTIEEARDRVTIETRQYAKRQRTWFRHQLVGEHIVHLDPSAADAGVVLASWWKGEGR